MNIFRRLLFILILSFVIAPLHGCVGPFAVKKKTNDQQLPAIGQDSIKKAEIPKNKSEIPPEGESESLPKPHDSDKDLLPTPAKRADKEPEYKPPPPQSAIDPLALRDKDEINRSALEFAKSNHKNAQHVKTCYSKMFGGWYVLIYVKNKGKYNLNQYSWNRKTREWEFMYINKNISVKQLKTLLEVPVADEKCFLLK